MPTPTVTTDSDDQLQDPRLNAAVRQYQSLLDAGQRPDRAVFLAQYPDLDPALADCLGGLELVHQWAAEAPIAARAVAIETEADDGLSMSCPLGDFELKREIGRGGMGIVYEAQQLSLGRRVAVKVLPFASAFDARHLQRFRREAQAAAQLHHTNIVPVYAVGCERGINFYAMQLIDGQSLAALIEQLRDKAAADPQIDPARPGSETADLFSQEMSAQRDQRRREYFRSAARLMIQAADALEHAHQFGIVHRDIKPANLLVGEHGRLWVTDFGLAQFHAEGGLTQSGDLLGTLRYMSPEQATGQRSVIDPRADIYSIGMTLYELATLTPAFDGGNRQQLLTQIVHSEPRSPRAIDPSVPLELDTIIMKAISKSPVDRYRSAEALAADLRRYLDDQPILARRPGPVERLRKWSRRHPSLVWTCVATMFVCATGLLFSTWMIAREQAKTAAALRREQQRSVEADRRFRQARQAVDLLVQECEEELGSGTRTRAVCKRLLEAALAYYQDFLDENVGNTDAEAELRSGQERAQRILTSLSSIQSEHYLGWINAPDVQDALKLSRVQRDAIAGWWDHWSDERQAFFRDQKNRTAAGRIERYSDLARENERSLNEILTPPQSIRFQQIGLQLMGPGAFQESYFITQLQLAADQRRQIRDFKEEQQPMMGPGGRPPGGDPGDRRRGPNRVLKMELDRILAILTPDQRRKYDELIGDPFPGAPRLPSPGPPPGPPPRN